MMENITKERTNTKIVLASTLHDPQGRMAPFLQKTVPFLTELYQYLVVIATPETAVATVTGLRNAGIRVDEDGDEHIGENRRRVLGRGLADTEAAYAHYCDLDRLLYWVLHHSDELVRVVTKVIGEADYTAIGRTAAAFASHPPVQQELESMTNEVFSALCGRAMDVTAGSCGISRPAGEYLLRHSLEASNATDTEWPSLVGRVARFRLGYVAVEGLAFETATFQGEGVYAQAHSADNWARRARLAHDSIAAAIRVHKDGCGAPFPS